MKGARDLEAHSEAGVGQSHASCKRIAKTYTVLLSIQVPQPPHEYLILLGQSEPRGEDFSEVDTALQSEVVVEVEEHVVEDRELLVVGVIAFADLVMKLV